MLDEIITDINERLSTQPDSRCASPDEVRICWLIGEIENLQRSISEQAKVSRADAVIAENNRAAAIKEAMLKTAGAAAHEINQPLQAISLYAEMIDECIKTGDHKNLAKHINTVTEQVTRAGHITFKMSNLKRYRTKKYGSHFGSEILDIEKSYISE